MVDKDFATRTVPHKGTVVTAYIYVFLKKIAAVGLTWEKDGQYTKVISVLDVHTLEKVGYIWIHLTDDPELYVDELVTVSFYILYICFWYNMCF